MGGDSMDSEVGRRVEGLERKMERLFSALDDLKEARREEREQAVRLTTKVEDLLEIMSKEDGFSRCVEREQRMRQLEKDVAQLMGGGCSSYKELKLRIEALESELEDLHTELIDKITAMEASMGAKLTALETTLQPINKKYIQLGAISVAVMALLSMASPFIVAFVFKTPH